MTEWIELPSNLRSSTFPESFIQKLQAPCKLIDYALVMCRRFIIHCPRTADEL